MLALKLTDQSVYKNDNMDNNDGKRKPEYFVKRRTSSNEKFVRRTVEPFIH